MVTSVELPKVVPRTRRAGQRGGEDLQDVFASILMDSIRRINGPDTPRRASDGPDRARAPRGWPMATTAIETGGRLVCAAHIATRA